MEKNQKKDSASRSPSPLVRQTSFARSFFDSGIGPDVLNTEGLTKGIDNDDMAKKRSDAHTLSSSTDRGGRKTVGRVPDSAAATSFLPPPKLATAQSLKAPPPKEGTASAEGATIFTTSNNNKATNTNVVLPTPRARPSNLQRRISSSGRVKPSLSYIQASAAAAGGAGGGGRMVTSGLVRGMSDSQPLSVAAMAAAISDINIAEEEPGCENDRLATAATATTTDPLNLPLERQPSWFQDALRQGQGMSEVNLRDILGVSASSLLSSAAATTTTSSSHEDPSLSEHFDDQEVIEQYRIMAQLDARQLFKEKVGMDVEEYIEQRRGNQKQSAKEDTFGTQNDSSSPSAAAENQDPSSSFPTLSVPTFDLKDPVLRDKLLGSSNDATITKLPGPPLPPLSEVMKELGDSCNGYRTVPEFQKGTLVPSDVQKVDTTLQRKEHIIKCQGCKSQLQVDIHATLVGCPSCSTVSPNTSSRR